MKYDIYLFSTLTRYNYFSLFLKKISLKMSLLEILLLILCVITRLTTSLCITGNISFNSIVFGDYTPIGIYNGKTAYIKTAPIYPSNRCSFTQTAALFDYKDTAYIATSLTPSLSPSISGIRMSCADQPISDPKLCTTWNMPTPSIPPTRLNIIDDECPKATCNQIDFVWNPAITQPSSCQGTYNLVNGSISNLYRKENSPSDINPYTYLYWRTQEQRWYCSTDESIIGCNGFIFDSDENTNPAKWNNQLIPGNTVSFGFNYYTFDNSSPVTMTGNVDMTCIGTRQPTMAPTLPTIPPTLVTNNPSKLTNIPTIVTNIPTKSTNNPTKMTNYPTIITDIPTKSTDNPTINPTIAPTIEPTTLTTNPTMNPSIVLSNQTAKTINPTKNTMNLTINPTNSPTITPTKMTNTPTINPSISPINNHQTEFPTKSPTILFSQKDEQKQVSIMIFMITIGSVVCLCITAVLFVGVYYGWYRNRKIKRAKSADSVGDTNLNSPYGKKSDKFGLEVNNPVILASEATEGDINDESALLQKVPVQPIINQNITKTDSIDDIMSKSENPDYTEREGEQIQMSNYF